MNQELLTTDLGKHVTIFVGIIDKQKRELMYAIGGHFPLPVLTCSGTSEYLEGKGMAVGLFPAPTFNLYKKALPQGFKITVFSDGVLEVISGSTLKEKEKLLKKT